MIDRPGWDSGRSFRKRRRSALMIGSRRTATPCLRTALASASIAAALLGLAACGSSSDDDSGATASSGGGGSSETDQNDLKVGYSSKGSDQFQLVMQEQ